MTLYMDQRARQHSAYQSQTVETASPARLIQLLFDGALSRIGQGRAAIEERDVQAAHDHLVRAQAIVTELSSSLNMKDGGELADRLAALYDYCTNLLVQANVRKDVGPLATAESVLTSLRDSWAEMTRAVVVE